MELIRIFWIRHEAVRMKKQNGAYSRTRSAVSRCHACCVRTPFKAQKFRNTKYSVPTPSLPHSDSCQGSAILERGVPRLNARLAASRRPSRLRNSRMPSIASRWWTSHVRTPVEHDARFNSDLATFCEGNEGETINRLG